MAALAVTVVGAEVRAGRAAGAEHVRLEREAFLMGTTLRVEARAGSRGQAADAIEAAFDSVASLEDRLSSWRSDAALGALRAAGRTYLDSGTARLLSTVRAWTRRTDGAFDPTVGALVEAWDLRGEGRRPTPTRLAAARGASGWSCLAHDVRRGLLVARCPGAWIDAGAFGKGAALDLAIEALRAAGATSGLLDFGGQIAVFGAPPAGVGRSGPEPRGGRAGWSISVAHPRHRDAAAVRLSVRRGSVATTSASERSVLVRDTVRGHVLDPRTGEPAPAWGSATVQASDPLVVDVLSTALFVMGPEEGLAWAEANEGVAALFLRPGPDGVEASWDAEMDGLILEVLDGSRAGRGARSWTDRGAKHRDRVR